MRAMASNSLALACFMCTQLSVREVAYFFRPLLDYLRIVIKFIGGMMEDGKNSISNRK